MNSSFLYHAWGLYSHKCTREEYKGNTIILYYMWKEKSAKGHVRHAVILIWSRTAIVSGILSIFRSAVRKQSSV